MWTNTEFIRKKRQFRNWSFMTFYLNKNCNNERMEKLVKLNLQKSQWRHEISMFNRSHVYLFHFISFLAIFKESFILFLFFLQFLTVFNLNWMLFKRFSILFSYGNEFIFMIFSCFLSCKLTKMSVYTIYIKLKI